MKIFLSWSGEYSKKVAEAFAEWIPCVIQSTELFLSTGSIDAGDLWHSKISGALNSIDFGFVFVTKENQSAPWLMFEAGALSKRVGEAKVIPVLCEDGIDDLEFKKNPLSHFQYVALKKDGIRKATRAIFDNNNDELLSEATFEKTFAHWIEPLLEEIDKIEAPAAPARAPNRDDRLAELEAGMSNLISMVRSINASIGRAGGSPFPQRVDFGLPKEQFLASEFASGDLLRRAATVPQIELAIEYIRERKSPTIQKRIIPELQLKLENLQQERLKLEN